MKRNIIVLIVLILIGIGLYFFMAKRSSDNGAAAGDQNIASSTAETGVASTTAGQSNATVIGQSVGNRDIAAYHYGAGATRLLFIGGIHGGYEWNTVLLAYQLMDYLQANPAAIPQNVEVTVIPVLNPDGLNKVVGTAGRFAQSAVSSSAETQAAGRFNANNVDLSRNFDCDWQASALWQSRAVSGGSAAFSEPESQALENYVNTQKPTAVVVWYSSAGGVFSSSCNNGILPETSTLTNLYAQASGYPAYDEFNAYKITGDVVDWLAKENIPAISVLLTTHTDVEWDKNLAGVQAILKHYAQ